MSCAGELKSGCGSCRDEAGGWEKGRRSLELCTGNGSHRVPAPHTEGLVITGKVSGVSRGLSGAGARGGEHEEGLVIRGWGTVQG